MGLLRPLSYAVLLAVAIKVGVWDPSGIPYRSVRPALHKKHHG